MVLTGVLAVMVMCVTYLFARLRRATIGTIEGALIWTADVWSNRSPAGYKVCKTYGWRVNGVAVSDKNGVIYRIEIKIKRGRICVISYQPKIDATVTYGNIYAVEAFIDKGLKVMGAAELLD